MEHEPLGKKQLVTNSNQGNTESVSEAVVLRPVRCCGHRFRFTSEGLGGLIRLLQKEFRTLDGDTSRRKAGAKVLPNFKIL